MQKVVGQVQMSYKAMAILKIVIVGASAAGKTTFARALSEKINIPATFMDEIMWNPGWNYVGDQQVKSTLDEIVGTQQWLIEGYIANAARANLFTQADQIIYLDYSGWIMAWRYIKRTLQYRKNPRPELPGSPETFSWKFLKLVFTKGETLKLEELFRKNPEINSKVLRFRTPKQASMYIKEL